ncbi:LamG domain-containing protein [uncultured Friedmanniella sp.]|uniref:LamG domain-containing protein n=1 Tax=uncultured Friedmanniella sp. TaxID=335381 RepID=UPI0035CC064A
MSARRPVRRPGPLVLAGLLVSLALSLLAALTPGSSAAFTARVSNSTDTAAAAPYFTCAASATGSTPRPWVDYPLQDALALATAVDVSGNNRTGTYVGLPTHSGSTACARDSGGSTSFNGSSSWVRSPSFGTAPGTFSLEIWFRTSTAGGLLIGFNNAALTAGTSYDRLVYLNTSGKLVFAVQPSAYVTVTSPASYTDGSWHLVAATFGTNGLDLYVDGVAVANNPSTAAPRSYSGYWRMGYSNLDAFTDEGSQYFTGQLSYAAVYTSALTAAQVAQHYAAGRAV